MVTGAKQSRLRFDLLADVLADGEASSAGPLESNMPNVASVEQLEDLPIQIVSTCSDLSVDYREALIEIVH